MQIFLSLQPLPKGIYGAACQVPEKESYFVFIANEASAQKQRFAFGHELAHIFLDHFHSDDPITIDREKRIVFHNGKEIDPSMIDTASKSEKEANARAWEFYRKYKTAFIYLKEHGKAKITE